jgi:hypothetical protein
MVIRNFNLRTSQVSKKEKVLEGHLPPLHTPSYAMVTITKPVVFQKGPQAVRKKKLNF